MVSGIVEPGQRMEESIVPACPQGLSINKTDFLKQDFSVDNFFIEVNVREGGASLDVLRDDLGVYLKVLRSSMIELINQDYADFVNLSTNLVGLDQGIIKIKSPLVDFQSELNSAKAELSGCLESVRSKLDRQERIRQDKEKLSSMQQMSVVISKVERMLGGEINTDVAERIATDINQLNFTAWKMKESRFIREMQPRLTAVSDGLNSWLDQTVISVIRDNNSAKLSRLLRIYATIDRISASERLVREEIIRPEVESCLVEEENISSSRLGEVCQALLRIIPEHLSELIKLTTDTKKLVDGSVTGFDFLAESYWPEVAESFLEKLKHVASPGNPEEFFKNYNISVKFLDDFEMNLMSLESLKKVRESESYNNFIQLWNLPVYYQIRFQEIAKPLETVLSSSEMIKSDSEECKLKATQLAKAAIVDCFSSDKYLKPLGHRFFQLSLQIISRYKVWSLHCLESFESAVSSDMKRSETSKNLQKLESKKTISKSASEKDLSAATAGKLRACLSDLVNLHCDILHLSNEAGSLICPPISRLDVSPAVKAAVAELSSVLPRISSAISSHLSGGPLKSLKSVVDIPRMYRRTNRETPSKPCSYVVSVVDSLAEFNTSQQAVAGREVTRDWLSSSAEVVVAQYLLQVQDVLSNVTKMEESLRKLKKVRGGAGDKDKERTGGLSDDDKIRLQLYLDVSYLLRELSSGCLGDLSAVTESQEGVMIRQVVAESVQRFIKDLNL